MMDILNSTHNAPQRVQLQMQVCCASIHGVSMEPRTEMRNRRQRSDEVTSLPHQRPLPDTLAAHVCVYLCICTWADVSVYLGKVYLSHDPVGRLFVLVLLPHGLQGRIMATQLRLDFLLNTNTQIAKLGIKKR